MLALVGGAFRPLMAHAAQPPNLIFFLADDLRWNVLGCMGDKFAQTPHIDRLVAQGVLFRNHFVTTSICCVSRASIFTGQYERRHHIRDFATPFTPAQWQATYPAILRKLGYRTGFIGKFGVGDDAAVKAMAGEFDFWRGLPGQGGLFFNTNDSTHTHATARMGSQALEFLDGCEPGRPFCLSISFTAPHARDKQPREFPPDPRDEPLFADAELPRPETAAEEFFRRLPESVQKSEARARWKLRFASAEMYQRTVKDYYRLVTGIDRELGRIVAELEHKGLAANTVIVFTSDNGFFLGERGLADKWFMYEESIRVPLIIFDPRRPLEARQRTSEAMTLNIDVAPSLLELAGARIPRAMQGRSLVPLLKSARPPARWRTEFFYEHHYAPKIIPPSEGIRTERWSYLRWINESPVIEELYDVTNDPLETRNLVEDPAHAATLAKLRAGWAAWARKLK
jgi:arylsulfatase